MSADFSQWKPFRNNGMHLQSDSLTLKCHSSVEKMLENLVARLHSGTIAGKLKGTMEATTPTGRRTSTSCDGSENSVPQRKADLSMFITLFTISTYNILLQSNGQKSGAFFREPRLNGAKVSTPRGTKRPWQPPRFDPPTDPANPWQRRPSRGLAPQRDPEFCTNRSLEQKWQINS